jgi:citrate synthase
MSDKATLSIGDKTVELPTFTGTEHEVGIDIGALRSSTGAVTIDNGFANTAPCFSSITFLDGEQGILRYRGYPIEQLAERSTFLECAWLLLYGELPSGAELEGFRARLGHHGGLHQGMHALLAAFRPDAHPMAVLASAVAGLAAFHPGEERTEEAFDRATDQLIAKLPAMAAASYRRSKGLPPVERDPSHGYTGNFLRMMFGTPGEPYHVDPDVAHALDVLLVLHADHEQNCSTSTVRLVGSSHANLFASVAAGVAALWGPLHGGANQKVLEMLDRIARDGSDVDKYVAMAKDKDSGFRLMGFGHRVYKNFDPRARIIQKQCDVVLERLGIEDPLLDIARKLERHALEDEYFVERKLYPNVDFYSGIIYRALGIPVDMFTVMFAIGRLPGWVAHWREFNAQNLRIGRPRQIYTGATQRDYVDLDAR